MCLFLIAVYIRRVISSTVYKCGDLFMPLPNITTYSKNPQQQHELEKVAPTKTGHAFLMPKKIQRFSNSSRRRTDSRGSISDNSRQQQSIETNSKSFNNKRIFQSIKPSIFNKPDENEFSLVEDNLLFSHSIQICPGLAYSTFEATSFSCIPALEKFLEVRLLWNHCYCYCEFLFLTSENRGTSLARSLGTIQTS